MSYNNPLGDMFSRLRNAYVAKQVKISVRNTRYNLVVLNFLYKEGYIRGYSCLDVKYILVLLKYIKNEPVFRELKQVSTPGNKVYFNLRQLKCLVNNRKWLSSRYIISTSFGLKTLDQCLILRLGGLVLFKIV
jgi:small subunit ribosomal protein S8